MLKSLTMTKEQFRRLSLPEKRKILRELSAELKFQIQREECISRNIVDLKTELAAADREFSKAIDRRDLAIKALADFTELV